MKTIIIKELEDGIPPPYTNRFPVQAFDFMLAETALEDMGKRWKVDAGISLAIPNGLTLRIESYGDWIVLGWTIHGGRLQILIDGPRPDKLEPVAIALVVREESEPVRFMQHGSSGGRLVRGDAQVANSSESEQSES